MLLHIGLQTQIYPKQFIKQMKTTCRHKGRGFTLKLKLWTRNKGALGSLHSRHIQHLLSWQASIHNAICFSLLIFCPLIRNIIRENFQLVEKLIYNLHALTSF